MNNYSEFQKELTELINKHSIETGSDTPDFILAEYLRNCLCTWELAMEQRKEWYKSKQRIIKKLSILK